MEFLVGLALLCLLFVGVGSLLGVVAFLHVREAKRRLAKVEAELRAVRSAGNAPLARAPAVAPPAEPAVAPARAETTAPPPFAPPPIPIPAPPPPPPAPAP